MSGPMQPYGSQTKCPKCGTGSSGHIGHTPIGTKWYPARKHGLVTRILVKTLRFILDESPGKTGAFSTITDEHLARNCNNCGFVWGELPLDHPSPLEQLARQAT